MDTAASLEEILALGGIEDSDINVIAEFAGATSVIASTTEIKSAEREPTRFNCIRCGNLNEISLPAAKGETRETKCLWCRSTLYIHRLEGGNYRVSGPVMRGTPVPAVRSLGVVESRKKFLCSNCEKEISYKSSSDAHQTVRRLCYRCLSWNELNIVDNTTVIVESVPDPVTVANLSVRPKSC